MQRQNSGLNVERETAVTSDIMQGRKVDGDVIGGDKITVGDIEGGYTVVGTGAQLTVNIHNEAPPTPEKPKLAIEPDMTFIPSGFFVMGSDEDTPEESPQHAVNLPDFHISIYPITNEEFAQFIWKTGRAASTALRWHGNEPPNGKLRHPVTGVTWYEALAYCEWLSALSGRQYALPSEAQWEKSARGADGRLFPWGNDWDAARCNAAYDVITPVDAYPAQSVYGCFDMVGNGREWTTTIWGSDARHPDKITAYPWQDDRRNELSEPSTTRRIFRGGRAKEPHGFRCTARNGYLPEKSGPKRNRHGFRVVLLPTI